MRRIAGVGLLVLLAVGFGAGYLVRGQFTKATTTTVVQIQTVAAPPPATHLLTAEIMGPGNECITADTSLYPAIMQQTFTLRQPGNGNSEGNVVAVAQKLAIVACDLEVQFKISPNLGFFVVSDEEGGSLGTGVQWGPFDSHQLASRGWTLQLTDSNP